MSTRLATRPRLLTLAGLALLFTAIVFLMAFNAGAAKASTPKTKTITSSHGTITRVSHGKTLPNSVKLDLSAVACVNMMDVAAGSCSGPGGGDDNSPDGTGVGAPNVQNDLTARNGSGNFVAGWNGVSDDDSDAAIGGHLTPPDQGLCVGPASALVAWPTPLAVPGNASVIVEPVNEAVSIYTDTGAQLAGPLSLADLFDDGDATGDVSCNYDPATKSFFFTEIGFDGDYGWTDIVVMNASGYAAYEADTGFDGECFPDFPQNGFDNNAFYISVNEFCEFYDGGALWGISKSQLASLSPVPNSVYWDGLGLDSPALAVRPAIGDGTTTEYLLSSEVLNDEGDYQDYANTLGFWWVSRDNNITSGVGPTYLYGELIRSEPYAQPELASSSGDGSCTDYDDDGCVITSEAYLNPDDDRMDQVQYSSGYLYSTLDTSLNFGDEESPDVWDGAAWFRVNTQNATVSRQGYVGEEGTNFLYPSMVKSKSGTYFMDFSLTGDELDPSTGYTLSKNLGNSWTPYSITGEGSGPHMSFSDIEYGEARWGDYSAMALDPANGSVWMADEYIPPADEGGSDPVDNWGTYVWGLSG